MLSMLVLMGLFSDYRFNLKFQKILVNCSDVFLFNPCKADSNQLHISSKDDHPAKLAVTQKLLSWQCPI